MTLKKLLLYNDCDDNWVRIQSKFVLLQQVSFGLIANYRLHKDNGDVESYKYIHILSQVFSLFLPVFYYWNHTHVVNDHSENILSTNYTRKTKMLRIRKKNPVEMLSTSSSIEVLQRLFNGTIIAHTHVTTLTSKFIDLYKSYRRIQTQKKR